MKKKELCLLCKQKITEDEMNYEDYFTVYRGFSPKCIEGCICFKCLKETHRNIKNKNLPILNHDLSETICPICADPNPHRNSCDEIQCDNCGYSESN